MRTTRSTLHSTLRHDAKRKTWPITRVFTRWTWAEASPATPLLSATFIPPSNGWACRSLVLLLIVGHLSGEREHRLLQVRGLQLDTGALRCRLCRHGFRRFGIIAEGQPAQTGARDVLNKEGRRGDGQGSRPLLEEGGHRLAGTGDQVDAAGDRLEGPNSRSLPSSMMITSSSRRETSPRWWVDRITVRGLRSRSAMRNW